MFRRFIFSSIGLSLVAAILIIVTGVALKFSMGKPKEDLRAKVDLIAKKSVENALENGHIDTADWERTLKAIAGTSTIDEKIIELQKTASKEEPSEPLTATDRFTRALLEKYVKYKNEGGVIDDDTTVRFVNELLARDYGGPEEEKIYTESDITILDTVSPIEIKKYANLIASALTIPVSATYKDEVFLINRMYETDDDSYLDYLPENIERYNHIRTLIANIAVPKELKTAHVALLNSLGAIIEGVRGMYLIKVDPVGATRMIFRYEDGVKSLDATLNILSVYFRNKNIIFSSSESGDVFN